MTKVILVTGNPATGKTSVAVKISEHTRYPLFSKDTIKELLMDEVGWSDDDVLHKLGRASLSVLVHILEIHLRASQPLILEAPFRYDRYMPKLAKIFTQYGADVLEVHCQADPDVLLQRYKERAESGERHPGHRTNYDELEKILRSDKYRSLAFGRLIELRTTHGIDIQLLLTEIDKFLES